MYFIYELNLLRILQPSSQGMHLPARRGTEIPAAHLRPADGQDRPAPGSDTARSGRSPHSQAHRILGKGQGACHGGTDDAAGKIQG